MKANKAYLLLGSNLTNPRKQLETAAEYIRQRIGTVVRRSSLYSTKAWGNSNQPDFLNQVLVVESRLPPDEMMRTILQIEKDMGRKRTFKYAPRTIDIDILLYDNIILQTKKLTIPHPLLQERKFVLIPLNELSPRLMHPVFRKSIRRLLDECEDELSVQKLTG